MVEVGFQWWMAMTRSLGKNTANICLQLRLQFTSAYRDRRIYMSTTVTSLQTATGKTLPIKLHRYRMGKPYSAKQSI